jgi:hypothetical protein
MLFQCFSFLEQTHAIRKGLYENRLPGAKDGTVKKEPYDSSTEKAKLLKIENFGTPDEIKEMAKPIRSAHNRQEAASILRQIAEKGSLTSKNGLTAVLPKRNIPKLVSDAAIFRSTNRESHYLAVANIDKLFVNAIEPWKFELNPNKNNQDLKERRILDAPLEYGNQTTPVKIIVKEYADPVRGTKIYSLETIDMVL